MTTKLPKWIRKDLDAGHFLSCVCHLCQSEKATSIAWAALDHYANTHEGAEARKAQRAIRRLGK